MEVYENSKDYAEWASNLSFAGFGMARFAEYSKQRLAKEAAGEIKPPPRKKKKVVNPPVPQEQKGSENEARECCICLSAPVQACIVPCGHLCGICRELIFT